MTEENQDTASDEKTSGTTETAASEAPKPKAKARPAAKAKTAATEKPKPKPRPTEAKAPATEAKPKGKAAAKPTPAAKADAESKTTAESKGAAAQPKAPKATADDDAAPTPEAAKPATKARSRKAAEPAASGRVTVSAHARYVRTSARKARLVCDHIRGKSVEEAYAILAHTPRHVAADWQKLLRSAVANAEHNHELVGEDLRIASVNADEGPTLKRFRPRAMGRASRIRKRTSHLSITLTPKEH